MGAAGVGREGPEPTIEAQVPVEAAVLMKETSAPSGATFRTTGTTGTSQPALEVPTEGVPAESRELEVSHRSPNGGHGGGRGGQPPAAVEDAAREESQSEETVICETQDGVQVGSSGVGESFEKFCDQLEQRFPFDKLRQDIEATQVSELIMGREDPDAAAEGTPQHADVNLIGVQRFLVKASRAFQDKLTAPRVDYLCDRVGAVGAQRDGVMALVKQVASEEISKRAFLTPQKRTATTRVDADKLAGIEDPDFEAFVLAKMAELGAERLSQFADLRITEGNHGLVREVMEAAYRLRPKPNLWHAKKLAEICLPDEHAVKNFLLLRCRRDGNAAGWESEKKKRNADGPRRTPINEQKGLGCSKCRYGVNGCRGCGYWDEAAVAAMDAKKRAKAEKEREAQAKKDEKRRRRMDHEAGLFAAVPAPDRPSEQESEVRDALSLVSPHVANAMVPKQPEASSGQSSGELGLDEKELLPPSLRGPPSEDAPAGEEQQRAVGPKTQIDL